MFIPEERDRLRSDLLQAAALDRRITGGAITGSGALGREDQWSDIDLAFGVGDANELHNVLVDFTTRMYGQHLALHHVDVMSGTWVYRVFLLPGTLQVDLAFAPEPEFCALAPTFRLIFGKAAESKHASTPAYERLIGLGWLFAVHARTCIARKKFWQAEYMISGTRDIVLELACLRHSLPVAHGRGFDLLPSEVAKQFEGALVRQLDTVELSRAFQVVIQRMLNEIRNVDETLAERLQGALLSLTESTN